MEALIKVIYSNFILSALHIGQAPPALYSEIAFLGRSNVGKSSLINLILNAKGLAKSSNTPGKTQCINYFKTQWQAYDNIVDFYMVDLPGFGYAKVSKEIQRKWHRNLQEFIKKRSSIKLFLHLRDARHPYLAIDNDVLKCIENFKSYDQKIVQIFTKCDKLNKNDLLTLQRQHKDALFSSIPIKKEQRALMLMRIYNDVLGIAVNKGANADY